MFRVVCGPRPIGSRELHRTVRVTGCSDLQTAAFFKHLSGVTVVARLIARAVVMLEALRNAACSVNETRENGSAHHHVGIGFHCGLCTAEGFEFLCMHAGHDLHEPFCARAVFGLRIKTRFGSRYRKNKQRINIKALSDFQRPCRQLSGLFERNAVAAVDISRHGLL